MKRNAPVCTAETVAQKSIGGIRLNYMPKKQDTQEEPADSVLVTERPPARKGKKPKKNKSRLPRKAKKEAKKARLSKT